MRIHPAKINNRLGDTWCDFVVSDSSVRVLLLTEGFESYLLSQNLLENMEKGRPNRAALGLFVTVTVK